MTAAVNIVVTCTKRKTRQVSPQLRLRAVTGYTIEKRAEAWVDRLQGRYPESLPTEALYAGDHWSVVRSLPAVASTSGLRSTIWICSAGYGLLSLKSQVRSYAATFSPGQLDSVTQGIKGALYREVIRSWWRLLSKWEGPERNMPRTISQIAKEHPQSPILVVASQAYLNAMTEDLKSTARILDSPDNLSIISAGAICLEGLNRHLVPCNARLQALIGGARHSLNVRIARKILFEACHWPLRSSVLRERFEQLLARQPKIISYKRTPVTDEEVRKYIIVALKNDVTAKHSVLLRRLRDRGYACEQFRFASLFHEIQREFYGF